MGHDYETVKIPDALFLKFGWFFNELFIPSCEIVTLTIVGEGMSNTPIADTAGVRADCEGRVGHSQVTQKQTYCDPKRGQVQINRWRALLAKSPAGDPGAILDRPDRRLVMLKIFGETKRLSELCMVYPRTVATTLTEGTSTVLAQTARQLTSLDWGMGGPDAIHAAITPLKDRVDLAISIAVLSGEWTVHKAAAARTDLAERICESVLSWLIRSAVKRGELRLPETEDVQVAGLLKGIFLLAGSDFAHEDISTTGPLDLVTVYDPAVFSTQIPNSNDRALIRIGAEFKDAIEGKPGSYPLYTLSTPFGSKLNGAGLMEAITSIKKIIKAPQTEILRSWLATARVVAGDRTFGGQFMEEIEKDVWNDRPLLTLEMTEKLKDTGHHSLSSFRSISQLCRLTMGRARPLFRTASTHDVIATAAESKIIPAPIANRLVSGHELARMLEAAGHAISGSDSAAQLFNSRDSSDDPEGIGTHLANLTGFGNDAALRQVMLGVKADANNALDQLLFGPRDAFQRYVCENSDADLASGDREKLEDLGFLDGALVSSIVESWLAIENGADPKSNEQIQSAVKPSPRFASRAPGLLTAFGETQYPTRAIKLFDQLVTVCPKEVDLYSVLEEGSTARECVVNAFGNFPDIIAPLLECTKSARAFVDHLFSDSCEEKKSPTDWVSSRPAPITSDIEALCSWRGEAIAQIAFMCASGGSNTADCVELLTDIHHETLAALYNLLKNGQYASDKKLTDNLVLFSCVGEWRSVPGDRASIGFILARKKKDIELEAKAQQFAEDYVSGLEKIGENTFSVSVDLCRRPGGSGGQLVANIPTWEQYVRTEAIAMDQIALARTHVVAGSKSASASARTILREVVANERRTTLTLRDLDRARTQHRARSGNMSGGKALGPKSSVWNFANSRGGPLDIELIIKVLMYRHGAANPWLQECDTNTALATMAESGLIATETATTLINARLFWASLSLVQSFSGWSMPEEMPIKKRFSQMLAQAAGVTSFTHIPPLIKGYTEDGNRLYEKLVLGRGDQVNNFASTG